MRRSTCRLVAVLGVVLCVSVGVAMGAPSDFTHQGRLLDASDNPVTGVHSLTFRIYDTDIGGTELWSEVHGSVTVTDGLFSVSLGSITPISLDLLASPPLNGLPPGDPVLYLSVTVDGGTELLPRLRVGTVPFARTSTRVKGDIETGPATLYLHDDGSSSTVRLRVTPVDGSELHMEDASSSSSASLKSSPTVSVGGALTLSSGSTTATIRASDGSGGGSGGSVVLSEGSSDLVTLSGTSSSSIVSVSNAPGSKGIVTGVATGSTTITASHSGVTVASLDCDDTESSFHVSGDRSGVPSSSSVSMSSSSSSSSVVCDMDSDNDGVLESSVTQQCDASSSRLAINTKGTGAKRTGMTSTAEPDSAVWYMDEDDDGDGVARTSVRVAVRDQFGNPSGSMSLRCDSDDDGHTDYGTDQDCDFASSSSRVIGDLDSDGIPDIVVSSSVDATSGRMAINTKGTPGSSKGSHRVQCSTDGSTVSECLTDDDDDGVAERSVSSSTSSSSASHRVYVDADDDGVVDYGTDDDCDGISASSRVIGDLDGDGIPDLVISSSVDASSSKLAIKTKGVPGKKSSHRVECLTDGSTIDALDTDDDDDGISERSISSSTSNFGSSIAMLSDLDDDGIADRRVSTDCDDTDASFSMLADIDDDGVGDNTVDQDCDGISARMAINSKGLPGKKSSHRVQCNTDGSSVTDQDCDDDDDGNPEMRVVTSTSSTSSSTLHAADLNSDGSTDRAVSTTCSSTYVGLDMYDQGGVGTPPSSITMITGGTIPPHLRMYYAFNTRCRIQPDSGLQLYDGSGSLSLHASDNGELYTSSALRVGVTSGSNHIDVAGGAYCDGTNWVNASDVNSKENFESVDGEEILEKLSQLEVSRWNYKGNETAEHIGPTAQDFKETFGLGADDKSISTIDPAGVALAAIKELYKQLKEKDGQLEELKAEIQKLQAEVRSQNTSKK